MEEQINQTQPMPVQQVNQAVQTNVAQPTEKSFNFKWLFVLGGVIILGVVFFFLFFQAKDCDTAECFITAANNCNKSEFTSKDNGNVIFYSSEGCSVTKTVVKISEDEDQDMKDFLEGKSLTCDYEKGEFDEDVVNDLVFGIEDCTGELKKNIGQLLLFT
ncbi:hypothetical protein ACFLZZ_00550 [Nanoarchaeota archaeon]